MLTPVTDLMRRETYRVLVEELLISSPTPKCPQLAHPIVDAAAQYIIGLSNDLSGGSGIVLTPLPARIQERLTTVVDILAQATASWDDFDERGLSVSKVRINEVMGYVDEAHRPEDLPV